MENIKDYTFEELEELVVSLGYEKYRAKQIWDAIYSERVEDFEKISTLPKELRHLLGQRFYISSVVGFDYLKASDGTIKFLFRLRKGSAVESVFIPSDKGLSERKTLCVSSQVGCALNCSFCATGKLGLKRNLTPGEIIDQIFECEKFLSNVAITKQEDTKVEKPNRLTNVVFMGMGEPLQNFNTLVKVLNVLTSDEAKLFSRKNITVSTSGIVPKIYELAQIEKPVKLAISLHTTDEELRKQLMPVAKKWSLKEIREAAVFYYRQTKIPITYEYILFEGLNDKPADVKRLAKFVRAVPSKVNIIPFHPIDFVPLNDFEKQLKPAGVNKVMKFRDALSKEGVRAFVRSSSGYEIKGACGQLAYANFEQLVENL